MKRGTGIKGFIYTETPQRLTKCFIKGEKTLLKTRLSFIKITQNYSVSRHFVPLPFHTASGPVSSGPFVPTFSSSLLSLSRLLLLRDPSENRNKMDEVSPEVLPKQP